MRVLKARLLRGRERAAGRRVRRRPEEDGRLGRPLREDPDLQLPAVRVTDHRIGFSSHRLAEILDGRLDELIDPLVARFQAEKLAGVLGREAAR